MTGLDTNELVAAHARTAERVAAALETGSEGLTGQQAALRADRYGPNSLVRQPGIPAWRLVVDEITNPLVVILIGAAAVLIFLSLVEPTTNEWRDALLILAIVVLNGCLGFAQNYRARKGIESLQRMATPQARVVRDGRVEILPANVLVPGDAVLLEEGDRVPADGRLTRAAELRVDESALTGESQPVTKSTAAVAVDAPLAERASMAYTGTSVASGRGRMLVVHTGMATEIGRIAEAVQSVRETPTPFQREVAQVGGRITIAIAILVAIIAALQLTVGGQTVLDTFVTSVALAVAAIPEGLPVVLTLALAFGTRRMLERRALVRSLPVVEIVGSAEIVCTDKTGTVTEGRMSLRRLYWRRRTIEITGGAGEQRGDFLVDGQPTSQVDNLALLAGAVCNDAREASDGTFRGDPTEIALLVAALKAGIDIEPYERLEEIPFSSERKRMSVAVRREQDVLVFVKGAPEVIVPLCTRIDDDGGSTAMGEAERRQVLDETERLAADAYRVLALAGKSGAAGRREEMQSDLVFYGLAAISDPPREAAAPALDATRQAGIRVVMITGDNPVTAAAVGREIGLQGAVMHGQELDEVDDERIVATSIFARVEPGHKLRILNVLRAPDRVVVMTGDGVNDAPALKAADVGIAMGERGTDVARDASDMVLLDDNFATIVAAIEEGRRISANIRKFLNYLLTGNLAEVLVILLGSLAGYLPVTAVQILWINLVTDSGPAVALAVDPAPPGLMREPPRRAPIFGRAMAALVGSIGLVIAVIVSATFFIGLAAFDLATAQTMTFTALVAQEYLRLAVIRVHEGLPLLANRWLVLAVGLSLALQVALIYTPLGDLFGVVPLGMLSWAVIVAGLLVAFPVALGLTRLVRRTYGPL